jgi:hypothetical protein
MMSEFKEGVRVRLLENEYRCLEDDDLFQVGDTGVVVADLLYPMVKMDEEKYGSDNVWTFGTNELEIVE